MIALLLGNFVLMAYDAKTTSQERVIRVWTQAIANFVQSPVTTVTSSVTGYFQSIVNLRSAQSENDALKQKVQELEVQVQQKEELSKENESLKVSSSSKPSRPIKSCRRRSSDAIRRSGSIRRSSIVAVSTASN